MLKKLFPIIRSNNNLINTTEMSKATPSFTAASSTFNPIEHMNSDNWKPSEKSEREQIHGIYVSECEKWRVHPNYHRTMAAHLIDDVHAHHRDGFAHIAQACKEHPEKKLDGRALQMFKYHLRDLNNHHQLEDRMFFPRTAKQLPEMRSAVEFLAKDHQYIHVIEEKVLKELNYVAVEDFRTFLDDHLDREEMLLVPYFLSGKLQP